MNSLAERTGEQLAAAIFFEIWKLAHMVDGAMAPSTE